MGDVLQAELLLQGVDLVVGAGYQDVVDVVDDALEVAAAVLRHALLDREEVAPVVVGGLDGAAAGVVCPEGSRGQLGDGGGQNARVGAAGVNPGLTETMSSPGFVTLSERAGTYSLGRVAAAVGVERQFEVAGEVDKVEDGVRHGVLLEILGVLEGVGQRRSPIAVCTMSVSPS